MNRNVVASLSMACAATQTVGNVIASRVFLRRSTAAPAMSPRGGNLQFGMGNPLNRSEGDSFSFADRFGACDAGSGQVVALLLGVTMS